MLLCIFAYNSYTNIIITEMKKTLLLLVVIIAITSFSCSNPGQSTSGAPIESTGVTSTGPDALIYKTKADYNALVPVILNAERTDIVSFPAPGDLKYRGKPAIPTELEDGFLLDNRGITENVAFLNITYEAYIALDKTPTKDELLEMIIDSDPLTVMFNCGKRSQYNNEVLELNTCILDNDFSKFKKLK